MFAVIAIAHVLFVSLKSVISMLLEYSLGKLKYDSTTLLMSVYSGLSPDSASMSPVSLAIFNFFINNFLVWVSPTPTPRTETYIDIHFTRIPDFK